MSRDNVVIMICVASILFVVGMDVGMSIKEGQCTSVVPESDRTTTTIIKPNRRIQG